MSVSEDHLAAFDARFAPELGSVVAARRLIQAATTSWGRPDRMTQAAALAVSELVTNAVLHAGTDVRVSIRPLGAGVRIEVRDGSDRLPTFEAERPEDRRTTRSMTGRGLAVVAALTDRWGVDPVPGGGKVMWAEIGPGDGPGGRRGSGRPAGRRRADPADENLPPPSRARAGTGDPPVAPDPVARSPDVPGGAVVAAAGPPRPDPAPAPVTARPGGRAVRLVGVPVRLLVESAGQLADLLREVQVMTLDPGRRTGSGDLAETGRRLARSMGPLSDHGFRSAELALARGDERADVEVDVPEDAVGSYRELDVLLTRLADSISGLALLTLPASDEVAAYRRWCGEEVVRQLAGAVPQSCPFGVRPAG